MRQNVRSSDFEQRLQRTSEEFRERLDLLQEAGQITELARWLTENALARVGEEFDLVLTEDNGAQFATHVAVALTRLQRGEPEIELSSALAEELEAYQAERQTVRRIMTECEELLDRSVPDVEVDYITVHACALLEEK